MATSKFKPLNDLPNLVVRTYKQGERAGIRKQSAARGDEISERLSACATPSDVADFASAVGLTNGEIAHRASNASNFGQFRMVIGNRVRGIIKVLEEAQKAGKVMSKEQAAALGSGKQFADPKHLPQKAPKAPKAEKPAKVKLPSMAPPKGSPLAQIAKPAPKAKAGNGTAPKTTTPKAPKTKPPKATPAATAALVAAIAG